MNKRYIDMPITASGGCPSTEATHRSVHDMCDVCDESESVHTHMLPVCYSLTERVGAAAL